MEAKSFQKTVTAVLDISDIDGEIEQLYPPADDDQKKSITKKILDLRVTSPQWRGFESRPPYYLTNPLHLLNVNF